jgi:hypothetical protein
VEIRAVGVAEIDDLTGRERDRRRRDQSDRDRSGLAAGFFFLFSVTQGIPIALVPPSPPCRYIVRSTTTGRLALTRADTAASGAMEASSSVKRL